MLSFLIPTHARIQVAFYILSPLVVSINQSGIFKKQLCVDVMAPLYHFSATGTDWHKIESLDEFCSCLGEHSRSGIATQEIKHGPMQRLFKILSDLRTQFVKACVNFQCGRN